MKLIQKDRDAAKRLAALLTGRKYTHLEIGWARRGGLAITLRNLCEPVVGIDSGASVADAIRVLKTVFAPKCAPKAVRAKWNEKAVNSAKDLPLEPDKFYGKEWKGWDDFLGIKPRKHYRK